MKTKLVTIHVTKQDIRRGIRGDENSCPIARAVKRVVGPFSTVEVNQAAIKVCTGETSTPAKMKKFITAFDNGINGWDDTPYTKAERGAIVKPFKAKLRLPVA